MKKSNKSNKSDKFDKSSKTDKKVIWIKSYTDKVKWRICILWFTLIGMLVYMVVVSEFGGGDSRIMTDLARTTSKVIFFGGFAYIAYRIYHNKNLLKNRMLLKEQMQIEQDERNQYLHDKSGGMVMDLLLLFLLFLTTTAALFNMAAFYTSFVILVIAIFLKGITYFVYSHK